MNEHDRNDGVAKTVMAVGLFLLLLCVAGGLFGVMRYRHVRMEAERAQMEEVIKQNEAARAAALQDSP